MTIEDMLVAVEDTLAQVARKCATWRTPAIDLIQEAKFQLVDSYHKFNPQRNTLQAWALVRGRSAMIDYLRKYDSIIHVTDAGLKQGLPRDAVSCSYDQPNVSETHLHYTTWREVDGRLWMNQILDRVNERDRYIIRLTIAGYNDTDIVELAGETCYKQVSNRRRRALVKLRKEIEANYEWAM